MISLPSLSENRKIDNVWIRNGFLALSLSLISVITPCSAETSRSEKLPGRYYELIEAELVKVQQRLAATEKRDARSLERGVYKNRILSTVLPAAVLYTSRHKANPYQGQQEWLDLAITVGDIFAAESENNRIVPRLNHDWELYMWLDAYRILEDQLDEKRRLRWRKQLIHEMKYCLDGVSERVDFPRYQSPFLGTSPNHFSLWASTLYLAGKVFEKPDWMKLSAKAMHRLASLEEQSQDGYWGEHSIAGPTTIYNYLTLCGVALYYEHSRDAVALEAIKRATKFHLNYTYPDGTPVEVINDRNRHGKATHWSHFAFSHTPQGRRYAEFLTDRFKKGEVGSNRIGRIAQNALYYHEGATEQIPQERENYQHRMNVPASIRKTGDWVTCLSGIISSERLNQFYLARQANVSVFHKELGQIISGGNSKHQPELATLSTRIEDEIHYKPVSSRLRMRDEGDQLALAYQKIFVNLKIPRPVEDRLELNFHLTQIAKSYKEARLTLQLCLASGGVLETASKKYVLGEKAIEVGPEEHDGWIRFNGWTMKIDPKAQLRWPVFPYNPYMAGPETEIEKAVGALTVPVTFAKGQGRRKATRRVQVVIETAHK